jgi:hypothetical protein
MLPHSKKLSWLEKIEISSNFSLRFDYHRKMLNHSFARRYIKYNIEGNLRLIIMMVKREEWERMIEGKFKSDNGKFYKDKFR